MERTKPFLPEHMREGMELYLKHGVEPGSFLKAVLCNNLCEAVGRADHINIVYLTNIVSYCYNEIPSTAWGSPDSVQKWMANFTEIENDPAL